MPELGEQELAEALLDGSPGLVALDYGEQLIGGRSRYTLLATGCRTVAEAAPDGGPDEVREAIARVERGLAGPGAQEGHALAGFLSYEAKDALEPAARRSRHPSHPLLRLADVSHARIMDRTRSNGALSSFTEVWDAARPLRRVSLEECGELDRTAYTERVRSIQQDIAAGEYYEINFTQRFRVVSRARPGLVALGLRMKAAAPYWAFLDFGNLAVISASPELFLRRRGRRLETKPIKGSTRRLADSAADRRQVETLRADTKNAAEHTMVVDLSRNDLGRVCRFGSVRVEKHAAVESFPTVHHLVSTVTGEPRPDVALLDLLEATFPAASITGAPKVRVMEAIAHFEASPRGIYTGAVGRFGAKGDLDLNVAIRTLTARPLSGGEYEYEFGAGGAVVADSDPEAEYEECLLKAEPLLAAILTAEVLVPCRAGD